MLLAAAELQAEALLISIFQDSGGKTLKYQAINKAFKKITGHTWNELYKKKFGDKILSKFCKESNFFSCDEKGQPDITYVEPK